MTKRVTPPSSALAKQTANPYLATTRAQYSEPLAAVLQTKLFRVFSCTTSVHVDVDVDFVSGFYGHGGQAEYSMWITSC